MRSLLSVRPRSKQYWTPTQPSTRQQHASRRQQLDSERARSSLNFCQTDARVSRRRRYARPRLNRPFRPPRCHHPLLYFRHTGRQLARLALPFRVRTKYSVRSGEFPIGARSAHRRVVYASDLHPVEVARNHQAQPLVRCAPACRLDGVEESMKRNNLCSRCLLRR
jgi:hypothetical protein